MAFIFAVVTLLAVRFVCDDGSIATSTSDATTSRMLIWMRVKPERLLCGFIRSVLRVVDESLLVIKQRHAGTQYLTVAHLPLNTATPPGQNKAALFAGPPSPL